jgi:hypothetical protein
VQLSGNYSYFYFVPEEVNYYKLTFNICMQFNPSLSPTLFYIESERPDGSFKDVPSLFETAKLVLGENGCTTFSTHYIGVKRKDDQSYRKIIVGLKVMDRKDVDKYLNVYPATTSMPTEAKE